LYKLGSRDCPVMGGNIGIGTARLKQHHHCRLSQAAKSETVGQIELGSHLIPRPAKAILAPWRAPRTGEDGSPGDRRQDWCEVAMGLGASELASA
jgi:hypothetical protein